MTNKRSCALLLATAFVCQACRSEPHPPPEQAPVASDTASDDKNVSPGLKAGESTEDQLLLAVSAAIRRAHLTTLPDECLAYHVDAPSPQSSLVSVFENHRHGACGGDPQTQPRLFTVRVDRATQAMSSDAAAPGDFRPLPH